MEKTKNSISSVIITILLVTAGLSMIVVTEPTVSASPKTNVAIPSTIITASPGENIDNLIAQMTLQEKVGQMIQGFATQAENNMPIEEARKLVQEYYVGSFMTCGISGPENVANFMNQMQEWAENTPRGIPLLSAIDADSGFREIGGDSSVLGATIFPMLMGLGATKDQELVRETAAITAKEARAMGIHWDLAPVVDVVTESRWRRALEAFGDNADLVSEMTAAQVQGYQMQISGENYQENGVMATAKHFPGHGGVYKGLDSHGYPSRATYSMEVLENVHLKPFKAAIDNGVESIMTGHIIVEAIDNENLATLSYKVITELLRENLGFDGVIISDALDMGPIIAYYAPEDAAVRAIKAGVDVLMVIDFESVEVIENAIIDAVNTGEISENRIDNSVKRILNAKDRLGLFDNALVNSTYAATFVGNDDHLDKALEASRKSITMLKNDSWDIPFSKNVDNVLVTGYESDDLAKAIDALLPPEVVVIHEDNFETAKETAKTVNVAIVTTYLKHWAEENSLSEDQIDLVENIMGSGTPMATVSLEKPYDIASIPDVPAHLCAYEAGIWSENVENAIAEVLFGDYNPKGKLSVSIPDSPQDLYDFGDGINYYYKDLEVSPKGVGLNENFSVSANVINIENYQVDENVKLYADDGLVDSKLVVLAAGENQIVSFNYNFSVSGLHTVTIDNLNPEIVAVNVSAASEYSRLEVPLTAAPNENITVSAAVMNVGSYAENENVKLYVNDNIVDSKIIALNGREAEKVNFTYAFTTTGTYTVTVDTLEAKEVLCMDPPVWIDSDNDGVMDDGEPRFLSIQAAIDNASSGDEIKANPRTYDTHIEVFPIVVNKSVSIRSAGTTENTIINAEVEGSIFRIEADSVVIDGFTIENSSADWWKGGIEIQNVQNVRIINNIIINNKNHGLAVWEGDHAYHEISGNTIENNIHDGVYLWGSKSNTIDNNIIRKNGTSLSVKKAGSKRSYSGISLHWAWDTVITNNTIENNAVHGIFLHGTEYQTGVYIQYNDIENNQDSGVWIGASSDTSKGDHNNFVGNEIWGAFKETSPTDDFSNCWWGSSDGPSGSGSGSGDAVNEYIRYKRYLKSRYEG